LQFLEAQVVFAKVARFDTIFEALFFIAIIFFAPVIFFFVQLVAIGAASKSFLSLYILSFLSFGAFLFISFPVLFESLM